MNNIDQLTRAINCFYGQSYSNKELVIVFRGECPDLVDWIRKSKRGGVKLVQIEVEAMLTLGELRNIAISEASGEYFSTWDDDDWYHCDRLKVQVSHVIKYKQPACVLNYIFIFDQLERQAYFSKKRIWEGSLLCQRSVFPKFKYQPWPWNEDANFIYQLLRNFKILPILSPNLYIYVRHGRNTCNEEYFQRLFGESQRLSTRASRLIGSILDGKYTLKKASRLLESDFLMKELNFLHGYLEQIKGHQA